jgi:hypothetical protein
MFDHIRHTYEKKLSREISRVGNKISHVGIRKTHTGLFWRELVSACSLFSLIDHCSGIFISSLTNHLATAAPALITIQSQFRPHIFQNAEVVHGQQRPETGTIVTCFAYGIFIIVIAGSSVVVVGCCFVVGGKETTRSAARQCRY